MVTEDALRLVELLKGNTSIKGVELTGSVAVFGEGRDVDIIILAPDTICIKFLMEREAIRTRWPLSLLWLRSVLKVLLPFVDHLAVAKRKRVRRYKTAELLNIKDLVSYQWLDVWVLPEDWRSGSHLNLLALIRVCSWVSNSGRTATFFEQLAQSSVRLYSRI